MKTPFIDSKYSPDTQHATQKCRRDEGEANSGQLKRWTLFAPKPVVVLLRHCKQSS